MQNLFQLYITDVFFFYKTNTSLPYATTNNNMILYNTMQHSGIHPTESSKGSHPLKMAFPFTDKKHNI